MTDYYVQPDGNNANTGLAAGAGTAFASPNHAASVVAAGDKVYVAAGTYAETLTIVTAGALNNPIVFEAYTAAEGDFDAGYAPIVTIDGASTRVNCVDSTAGTGTVAYMFKGFRFTGATGNGFDAGGGDYFKFNRCRFDNNGADGFAGDNGAVFEFCELDNNNNKAIDMDLQLQMSNSRVHDNADAGEQVRAQSCTGMGSVEFWGAAAGADHLVTDGNNFERLFLNVTFDGEAVGQNAIQHTHTNGCWGTYLNTVIHDQAGGGIVHDTDTPDTVTVENCAFNAVVGADYPASAQAANNVNAAPGFTDEAGHDYSLDGASALVDAGVDVGVMP